MSTTFMLDVRHDLAMSSAIGWRLVCDNRTRYVTKASEQLAKEPLYCFLVSTLLDQNIQHLAFLIYRTPELDLSSVDLHKHLIEVPRVTASPTIAMKSPRVFTSELKRPKANSLVRDFDATLQHHFLNITKTQAETKVEPCAMRDDFRRKAVTAIQG